MDIVTYACAQVVKKVLVRPMARLMYGKDPSKYLYERLDKMCKLYERDGKLTKEIIDTAVGDGSANDEIDTISMLAGHKSPMSVLFNENNPFVLLDESEVMKFIGSYHFYKHTKDSRANKTFSKKELDKFFALVIKARDSI